MKKTVYNILFALSAAALFAAPLKAQLPHLIFHAELNGAEQIPAVATNAKGLITLMYSPDRTKATVTGLLVDLQGDVTAATLHIGKTGQVGAAIVDLMPTVHGKRLHGEVVVPAALLENLLPDRAYVSVSTTAHPSGEIRGQFICETDLEYGVALTGSSAVPANNSTAFGFGGLHFPTGSEDVVYAFQAVGLSSPITSVGLYKGDPGQTGPLAHIMVVAGGFIQGLMYIDDLPPNFLRDAREGKYYVAIKTEAFPDGEIRGQVGFLGYFTSLAPLNGAQQVPPGPTPGFAFSHNILNQTLDSLTTTLFVSGITPVSVDIHKAPLGTVGPKLGSLTPTATPGLFQKTYALGPNGLSDFAEGRLYLNIPTIARPNGEIRGQMKNSLRKGYAFDLCGEQVVPPTTSAAFGVGMASVDQANCYLNYKVIHDQLSGAPTGAFISQAFPTMNGNALYPIPSTGPIIPGIQEIMASHGVAIELGETYVLLTTADYPNGEIRGQIVRGFSCPEEMSGTTARDNISHVNVSPVPFNDVLNVSFDSQSPFEGRIVLYDILGATALTYPVQVVAGNQTLQISAANLPAGYYTMMLETPNQGASMLLKKLVR
jgi:hypothetical protein